MSEDKRYRALADGVGYPKDTIFTPVGKENHPNLAEQCSQKQYFFSPESLIAPVFHVDQLETSPDFEEFVPLWEPGYEEEFYTLTTGLDCVVQKIRRFGGSYTDADWQGAVKKNLAFLTEADAQNCLDEKNALIKKRSTESRKI